MASSQVSSGKKRFVHIRDLTFHPSTLKCSIGDLIIFIHDGEAEETHSLCIPEVANSPILKKGQRWEYLITSFDLAQDSKIVVIDSLYSFMKVIIRVKVTSSLTSTPSQPSINTTERYADSFVYAAANVIHMYNEKIKHHHTHTSLFPSTYTYTYIYIYI